MTWILMGLLLAAPPVESLLAAHGWGRPTRDPALDAAARALASRVDLEGGEIAGGQLRFLLGLHQVADAEVVPFTVLSPLGAEPTATLPPLLGRLERRLPPTHYGAAAVPRGGGLMRAVLLVHRGVLLDGPPPREANPGSTWTLRGALRPGYFRPRLLVAPPPPHPVRERPAWSGARAVEVTVFFDAGPGVYGVELVAESQYGPVVLTNHRVWVGEPAPTRPVVQLSPGPTRQAPGPVLVSWINALRTDYRHGVLRVHPGLEAVAREHARDLAGRQALVHLSPDSGTLSTRLKAQGLRPLALAENLARADDVRGAMRAFLESPGHRRNLLLPGLTHIGVGAAGRYYTVVLARLSSPRGAGPSGSR